MDIAHHRAAGFQHAGAGLIGQVGGHALIRHQPRTLAHQDAHQLTAGDVAHRVPRAHPAIADEDGGVRFDAPQLQAVPDGGGAVHGVGDNGCRGKPVADDDLHPGVPRHGGAELGGVLLVKAAPQVGSGQVFILAAAASPDLRHAVVLRKILRHLGKHRILRRRVIRPEAEHGQRPVARSGLAAAQPRRGFLLQEPVLPLLFRLLHQIESAQIQRGDVRHKIPVPKVRRLFLGLGLGRAVIRRLDLRLVPHLIE